MTQPSGRLALNAFGDLINDLGGWPNLMQGLGSNIVAGVLAGLVAWGIFARTRRSETRLANELDARAAAREMMSALSEAAMGWTKALRERDRSELFMIPTRLGHHALTHRAAIEHADRRFVEEELMPFLEEVLDSAKAVASADDYFDKRWSETNLVIVKNITSTSGLLALWLHTRTDSKRARLIRNLRERDSAPRPSEEVVGEPVD